jgi:hypothetical protein
MIHQAAAKLTVLQLAPITATVLKDIQELTVKQVGIQFHNLLQLLCTQQLAINISTLVPVTWQTSTVVANRNDVYHNDECF